MNPNDTKADDHASMWQATADLFEQTAVETDDAEERQRLLEYAKLYREMAARSERSEPADDAEVRPEADVRSDDDDDADWLWTKR